MHGKGILIRGLCSCTYPTFLLSRNVNLRDNIYSCYEQVDRGLASIIPCYVALKYRCCSKMRKIGAAKQILGLDGLDSGVHCEQRVELQDVHIRRPRSAAKMIYLSASTLGLGVACLVGIRPGRIVNTFV